MDTCFRRYDSLNKGAMEQKQVHVIVPSRLFVTIWIALLVLTAATIGAARLELGAWSMFANLFIASSKASLVLWFFMHLKYEGRLFKLLFLVPVATITLIIGLTFFDIGYR